MSSSSETADVLETGSKRLPRLDLDSYRVKDYLTHSIHPYPAKFVPQIPAELIACYSQPGNVVLDPFCGSGTTLLEAALAGRKAIGVDSNKLATLIAQAKTQFLTPGDSNRLGSHVKAILDLGNTPEGQAAIPDFLNRDHWFDQRAQGELAKLKAYIADAGSRDHLILSVAFASIVVKCSRQESETRWRAVERPYKSGQAYRLMAEKLVSLVSDLRELSERLGTAPSVHVYNDSATELNSVSDRSVDLLVTSPPYMNSFDYYLYHKLRFFWLGLDHKEAQSAEIGSRNKHCDQGLGADAFYNSVSACFAQFQRVLKDNAIAAFVVGDSVKDGQLIEMDAMYERLAEEAGFRLVDKRSFDQRRYTRSFTKNWKRQHKQSHVLAFEKAR